MTIQDGELCACRHIPQEPDLIATHADKPGAIRTECELRDSGFVPAQSLFHLAGYRILNKDSVLFPNGSKYLSIGRHGCDACPTRLCNDRLSGVNPRQGGGP